jgi:hypothetical protein
VTSADGDAVGFRNLSANSKRVYKRGGTSPISAQSPESESAAEDLPEQNPVGRPPLDPEKGPMRESSLQKRRAVLSKDWRKEKEE